MGTTYTVKAIQVPAEVDDSDLQPAVEQILEEINRQMSTYDRHSELSRFNDNQTTDWVTVSPALLTVIEEALRVSGLTGGAFDVTVGPLVNLWGFGPTMTEDDIPADEEITSARARVGYRHVHTQHSPSALKKDRADIAIDLSAIAKGYAVDQVAKYLESLAIANYLVEIGGELKAKGRNPQDQAWTIAIEEPAPGKRAIKRVIQITDRGLATSGDYRNFFEKDGRRYSHAMDPRTGRPVQHRLASVTVVSETAMQADAMATALLVLGPEAGYALAQQEELAAFFIVINDDGFAEKSTPEFKHYFLQ